MLKENRVIVHFISYYVAITNFKCSKKTIIRMMNAFWGHSVYHQNTFEGTTSKTGPYYTERYRLVLVASKKRECTLHHIISLNLSNCVNLSTCAHALQEENAFHFNTHIYSQLANTSIMACSSINNH